MKIEKTIEKLKWIQESNYQNIGLLKDKHFEEVGEALQFAIDTLKKKKRLLVQQKDFDKKRRLTKEYQEYHRNYMKEYYKKHKEK